MSKSEDKWVILIVDDEEFIHDNLNINLRDIEYKDREIEFLNAYSALEAKEIIKNSPKIAVIILDVMMEEDDAGLGFVKFIRDEVKNDDVRIILHTGQPGIAPKKEVANKYMIDGYLDKNTTDNDDSYAAVRVAIRSFDERMKLKSESTKDDLTLLSEIADSYVEILNNQEISEDYEKLLAKINNIVHLSQEILASYAMNDLKNDLTPGTTKSEKLTQKDYSSLIQIYDLKIILIHTSLEKFKEEKTVIFDTIVKIIKNFSTIGILPDQSKKILESNLKKF